MIMHSLFTGNKDDLAVVGSSINSAEVRVVNVDGLWDIGEAAVKSLHQVA